MDNEVSILNDLLEKLEQNRIQFFEKVNQTKEIKEDQRLINKKLAHFEICDSYQTLMRREREEREIRDYIDAQKNNTRLFSQN